MTVLAEFDGLGKNTRVIKNARVRKMTVLAESDGLGNNARVIKK